MGMEYGNEASELFAHEIDDGGFVRLTAGAEFGVVSGVFGVRTQRTEGGLEEGGTSRGDTTFGDLGAAHPLARAAQSGVGATQGLKARDDLLFPAPAFPN